MRRRSGGEGKRCCGGFSPCPVSPAVTAPPAEGRAALHIVMFKYCLQGASLLHKYCTIHHEKTLPTLYGETSCILDSQRIRMGFEVIKLKGNVAVVLKNNSTLVLGLIVYPLPHSLNETTSLQTMYKVWHNHTYCTQ